MGEGAVAAVHQADQLDQRPLFLVVAGSHLLAAVLGQPGRHLQGLDSADELGHVSDCEDVVNGLSSSSSEPRNSEQNYIFVANGPKGLKYRGNIFYIPPPPPPRLVGEKNDFHIEN